MTAPVHVPPGGEGPVLQWWHVALLRVLDEQGGATAGTIGKAVWTNFDGRAAASTATPHLKRLREWGLATLLDAARPMIWLRTPAGTQALIRLDSARPSPETAGVDQGRDNIAPARLIPTQEERTMAKMMTVTLRLRVEEVGDPDEGDEVAPLDEFEVEEVADVLTGLGEPEMADELFAGSMIFAKFTDCRVVSCQWEDAESRRQTAEDRHD